jgi:hypothetical protein
LAAAAVSVPPAAVMADASAELLSAPLGSSATAFRNRHRAEFASSEGGVADFYMGAVQGLPAFIIYTRDGDRITGHQTMVSGTREAMKSLYQTLSANYQAPGAPSEQVAECRDAGSKTAGWHLEATSLTRSRTEILSYREDPTNHAVVVSTVSPAGVLSIELLNKAYSDLLARPDLETNELARQWLGLKAAYDDVSRSPGLSGCRMSRGGAPGNLPLKLDVALTQTGAQVVNGTVSIAAPVQFGGLNFTEYQVVLSAGKVVGFRFSGNVSQSVFNQTLTKTASALGDPMTLVTTSNGAVSQTVATFRPTQDARARRVQTVLSFRSAAYGIGNSSGDGVLVFDIH